ncbi:MAG TPA: hypothetical protein VK590_00390 [Saprospiraceae bacterium]|nr:hypothetical protein [Saprospiraceae bacterium]
MNDQINVLLSREEIEWIARFCQRAIRLTDMNIQKPELKIFDPEFNENKEKALKLKSKMVEALR